MLDHLLDENNLRTKLLLDYDLDGQDILFVKELIAGPIDETTGLPSRTKPEPNVWPYRGRPEGKSFLYEIVANKISGIQYSPNLLFGSLQNISAPVGLIEKLRPLYYIKRPIPLLMSQVIGL